MTTLARIAFDDTLRLRLRRMSAIRATLLGKRLLAAYRTVNAAVVPAEGLPLFTRRASELEARVAAMEVPAAALEPSSFEPSAAALALAPREVLAVPVEVDRLLEGALRPLHEAALAYRDDPDELGDAARLLIDRLFEDGRRFVLLSLDEQFQETASRLTALGDGGLAAATLLRRADALSAVTVLNAHLGELLHITAHRDAAAPQVPAAAVAANALLSSLNAWMAAVVAVWPEDHPDQLAMRRTLLQPLVDELSR